ncbi:MAG: glycosyltransferase family 2 protein, partial [Nanoarchaeota archaeon]
MVNISVVIPVYNEEKNVEEVLKRVRDEMIKITNSFEIIFIDDGSKDSTFGILKSLKPKNHELKIIKFQKNFGQTPAMLAGFKYAKGDIIVTMDGDMQNDPKDIQNILNKIKEGYDVVSGWRYKRSDPFLTKKLPSLLANGIRRMITKEKIHDSGCS